MSHPYRTAETPEPSWAERHFGPRCPGGSHACRLSFDEHFPEIRCGICGRKKTCVDVRFLVAECRDGKIRFLCVSHRSYAKEYCPWPRSTVSSQNPRRTRYKAMPFLRGALATIARALYGVKNLCHNSRDAHDADVP